MKDRYDEEILVGDKVRVGLGGVLLYEVVRFDRGDVIMLDSKGNEFAREPHQVSVCLRERK